MSGNKKVNPFEFMNREIKKDIIIRAIYAHFRPGNGFERGALAALLRGTTQKQRDHFALQAGAKHGPSEETWKQIVEEIASGR